MTTKTDADISEIVSAALDHALEIVEDEEGWKVEIEDENVTIKVRKNEEDRKVWLCTTAVDVSPKILREKLAKSDYITSWNTSITEAKTIRNIAGDVKVVHLSTSEKEGNTVSTRDLVYGSKMILKNGMFMIGGISVEVAELPEEDGCVRVVQGPGCQIVEAVAGHAGKSLLTWMMDFDYKDSSIIETAVPSQLCWPAVWTELEKRPSHASFLSRLSWPAELALLGHRVKWVAKYGC